MHWRRKWQPGDGTPGSILAWRIPGTGEPGGLPSMGSHWAAVYGVAQNRTRLKWLSSSSSTISGASLVAQMVKRLPAVQETWVRSLGREDPLEKEMATHSSTLAWKIPWTEEPCRLQSLGLQRVRHDWETSQDNYKRSEKTIVKIHQKLKLN